MRSGEPGSLEWTRPDLYPNVSEPTPRQRSRIISPSLAFKTDDPLLATLLRMLRILEKVEFSYVYEYKGPDVGFHVPPGETVAVGELIEALAGDWDSSIPLFGIRVKLVYETEEGVMARLKVGGGRRTKVALKIKGTMRMSDWTELVKRTKKKFAINR
jgi:hypothetical protein